MMDRIVMLIVLVGLCMLPGCGDPGTGGSGVPPGSSAAPVTTPVDGSNAALTTQIASGRISSVLLDPTQTGASSIQIVVSNTRFDVGTAVLVGADGTARSSAQLQVGVLVALQFSANADVSGASVNATGAAVVATRVMFE
jgi:hypothetical protein